MSGKRGGKFSKPARGGGKKFSRGLGSREDEEIPGMWSMDNEPSKPESEEEDEEDEGERGGSTQPMTREERRAAEKARKEAAKAKKMVETELSDDEEEEEEEEEDSTLNNKSLAPGNPNASGAAQVSRKEREAKEAAAAKERYMKLHAQGKTDEAKADLARLAQIRKERELKAKQRQAELEEKKRLAEAKLAASGKKK
ncbi:casein kinase substrate phosphoprotein PP28-domain-containing protein [Kalaharituber pfeilii]|nr:casein kinase substrate phosphoprotein PP28-domain-containing protein [Kalaharituber pfeilii]